MQEEASYSADLLAEVELLYGEVGLEKISLRRNVGNAKAVSLLHLKTTKHNRFRFLHHHALAFARPQYTDKHVNLNLGRAINVSLKVRLTSVFG